MAVYRLGGAEVYLEGEISDYKGAALITGFRGFGMIGYNVTKYLALGLGARKVGFIVAPPMPPVVVVEEDGPGFPYEVYYSPRADALLVVNRALPEKEYADTYTRSLAELAVKVESRYTVLVGGLNANFRPEEDKHGYRHLKNKYYSGPELSAPEMEEDLGVVGPLALVFIYATLLEIPSVVVLPYAVADQIDIDGARRGIEVISEEILGVSVNMKPLEEYAKKLAAEKEKILQMIAPMLKEREKEEAEEKRGMYM